MYPRIGVDLVNIPRVKGMIATAFASTIRVMLLDEELADCQRAGRLDAVSVAGRLAIKEAVFKTFRSCGHPLPWTDIHVHIEQGGAPAVTLRGRAHALASAARMNDAISVSLAHEDDYAIAVAFCIVSQ